MGILGKIFKPIGKVFKKIGKFIKKGFKAFGKLVNKAGIFGQIGMMVLSMYAGPALFKSLSNSFIGTAFKTAGSTIKGLGTAAKTALESTKIGKILVDGAARVANAATSAKRMTLDQLGSLTKGTTNMVKSTMQAAGEKLGLTVGGKAGAAITPELTSVTYTPGTGVTAQASGAVTKAAGGEGLKATAKAIADNTTEQMANNFWDAKDLARGGFKGGDPTTRFARRLADQSKLTNLELGDVTKLDPETFTTTFTPESRADPTIFAGSTPEKSILDPSAVMAKDTRSAAMGPFRPDEIYKAPSIDIDTGQFKEFTTASESLLQPKPATPTGALTDAQKEFMTDTSKYDVGEFAKQQAFNIETQSPIATVTQGASPLSKFNIEPLTPEQKKGIQISTFDASLKAGIAAASDPIEQALEQGSAVAYGSRTAPIGTEIYQQVGIGSPAGTTIPAFGPQFENASNFLNTYGINNPLGSWEERTYDNWLTGAYGNQQANYAMGV